MKTSPEKLSDQELVNLWWNFNSALVGPLYDFAVSNLPNKTLHSGENSIIIYDGIEIDGDRQPSGIDLIRAHLTVPEIKDTASINFSRPSPRQKRPTRMDIVKNPQDREFVCATGYSMWDGEAGE